MPSKEQQHRINSKLPWPTSQEGEQQQARLDIANIKADKIFLRLHGKRLSKQQDKVATPPTDLPAPDPAIRYEQACSHMTRAELLRANHRLLQLSTALMARVQDLQEAHDETIGVLSDCWKSGIIDLDNEPGKAWAIFKKFQQQRESAHGDAQSSNKEGGAE